MRKVTIGLADEGGDELIVQGFRRGEQYPAYVFMGVVGESADDFREISLTPQAAHELSEIVRQEAEFAQSKRAEEDGK